jgi:DeoR/GlpR family transcriptional regulator of sugar metabolism
LSRRIAQQSLGTQAFDVSRATNVEAKRAIARRALEMCVDRDAIIINGGVTTLITDRAAPPEALAMLRDAGVETIVVDPETRTTEAA